MKKLYNVIVGNTYDDLLCIGVAEPKSALFKKRSCTMYKMKCTKCGREKYKSGPEILKHNGTSHKACGQFLKTKDSFFYDRWTSLRTRTTNPNYEHADRYSGRGITSNPFRYFVDFYDAMFESWKKMAKTTPKSEISLERINNDEGYSKENCKWINVHDQAKNTSRSIKLEITHPDGHVEYVNCATDWCKKAGLSSTFFESAFKCNSTYKKGYKFRRLSNEEYRKLKFGK